MSSSLSHFPDLCLLGMFKHIPLDEVICTVGLVCKNWARLQGDELKRRRTLVIVQDCSKQLESIQTLENPFGSDLIEQVRRPDGSPLEVIRSLDQIKFNALQTTQNGLTEGFSSQLIEILPNIIHLTFMQSFDLEKNSVSTLIQMTRMINHYSARLESLKIDFSYDIRNEKLNNEAHLLNTLVESINQLSSLRHLQLNIYAHPLQHNLLMYHQAPFETKLTILSQLRTFSVHKFDNTKLLHESMRQYATGDVRISMKLGSSMKELLLYGPLMGSKFCGIGFSDIIVASKYDRMQLFCSRFASLSSLELSIHAMSMTMLARCLSKLTKLIHLKLRSYPNPLVEQNPQLEIAQIPSVCLLTLTIWSFSHHHIESLHLPEIFPNLQVLHLIHIPGQCNECDYNGPQAAQTIRNGQALDTRILHTKIEQCIRLTLQPVRSCTKLHTIKLDSNDEFKAFLPQGIASVDQL